MSIDPGLCAHCQHAHITQSDKGSVFYRCSRAKDDLRYSKYPRLPVLACPGFEAARSDPSD